MSLQSFSLNNLFGVKGKVVIVTGGGTGIGRAIATALTVNGAKETAKELNTAAQEAQSGGECIPVEGNVATKEGVVEVYEKVSKLTDKNDPVKLEKMLWSIEDVDFANMTVIHVSGPYLLAVKCIPLLQKSNDACVTNITSLASHFLNRACCEFAYAQSKAAETHLTQLMAAGLSPFNIRVNSIAPGIFKSQLTTGTTERDAPLWSVQQNQLKNIPKGHREGHWEEVAGAALMLISPAGGYTNGANIIIDGGWRLFTSAKDVQ
uniref:Short-chain dehydrogenase n=1 Tax=Kwoniella bestiolae CBS 10118 TaxID=1296100 RepID=A0A1B9FUQ0_9TREE|nr:hypothetical protein I302_08146 [Kwoniella bestiolae CBS 10118]OCF22496.1 hypothetical protein I302_08146 [Kwoniella bestiolae CBS 10118]